MASKLKQDNATEMILILVKKDNRQGNLEGWSSLAVLGCRDWLRVMGQHTDKIAGVH